MKKLFAHRGFSLVELMIGTMITIFAISAGALVLRTMTVGMANNDMSRKAQMKMGAAFEEIRRTASTSQYNAMGTGDEFDCHYTQTANGGLPPNIKVCAKIDNISSDNRSRAVTLVASYQLNGVNYTSTKTFSVANARGKSSGSKLYVRVVDTETVPIANIDVTVPLLEGGTLKKATDSNGLAVFENTNLLEAGVDITVDGIKERCYFRNDGGPCTWSNIFHTGPTRANQDEKTFYDNPIIMKRPGSIQGKITDINIPTTGIPIPAKDVVVQLYFKATELTLSYPSQMTAEDGTYRFDKVVPGQYFIYVNGSSRTYAAISRPNDRWSSTSLSSNPGEVVSIYEHQTSIRDFQVIKRGLLKGKLRTVNYSNGSGFTDSPANHDKIQVMFFSRFGETAYVDFWGSTTTFSFSNSQASAYINGLPTNSRIWRTGWNTTNTLGDYTIMSNVYSSFISRFLPEYVHPDYSFSDQKGVGILLIPCFTTRICEIFDTSTVSNLVPIIVHCPSGFGASCTEANVQMMLVGSDPKYFYGWDFKNNYRLRGVGVSSTSFTYEMKAGIDTEKNFNLLSHDAMGSVTGTVTYGDSTNCALPENDLTKGQIIIDVDPLKSSSTYVLTLLSEMVAAYPSMTSWAFMSTSPFTTSNFATGSDGCHVNYNLSKLIPPTITNDDKFVVKFERAVPTFEQKYFKGTVKVVEKTKNATTGIIALTTASGASISGKKFPVYDENSKKGLDVDMGASGEINFFAEACSYQGVSGQSDLIAVSPGGTTVADITVTANSSSYPKHPWNIRATKLQAATTAGASIPNVLLGYSEKSSANFSYDSNNNWYVADANPAFVFKKIGTTGIIQGTIKAYDSDGQLQPLIGATISITEKSSYASDLGASSKVSQAESCPSTSGCGMNYYFNNVRFYPAMGSNITIKVGLDGYESTSLSIELYEGYSNQIDFILTKTVSAQSGQ